MEWAEAQQAVITDLKPAAWDEAEAAESKLHYVLLQLLGEYALILIDTPELEGRGFEAWCLLVKQYNPSGNMYEVDALMALMTSTAACDITALPGAVAKFERDHRLYGRRSGRPFPEEFKPI